MAKSQKSNTANSNESVFYTRLLVSRQRKVTLGIIMAVYFVLFASLLYKNIIADVPWMVMAVPIIVAGSLFVFFPATEEWEYKPWQNKQQKQERLFLN